MVIFHSYVNVYQRLSGFFTQMCNHLSHFRRGIRRPHPCHFHHPGDSGWSLRTPIVVVFCCFPCITHWPFCLRCPWRSATCTPWQKGLAWPFYMLMASRSFESNPIRSMWSFETPRTLRVPVRCVDILSYFFMTCLLYLSVTRLEKLRPIKANRYHPLISPNGPIELYRIQYWKKAFPGWYWTIFLKSVL